MNSRQTKQLAQGLFRWLETSSNRQQLRRYLPGLVILAVVIIGLKYAYEVKIARPAMSYMGVPQTTNDWHNLTHTLRNDGYMLGYSERLKNPLWVSYRVTQDKVKFGKRPNFKSDWRSLSQVHPRDYSHSGYDRGHMAPNYVIGSRYGRRAQQQTFLMTNITPQKPKFNQKIWQRLEEVSADHFSKKFDSFWVITGPIFDKDPKTLKNSSIAIPKAFYKIFVVPGEHPKALAFIMPQSAKPRDSLLKYVTTIDAVEKQTGIDFFWQLPDDIENQLEKSKNSQAWSLQKVANRAPRY